MLTLNIQEDGKIEFSGRSMQITKEKNQLLAPFGKMISNVGIVCKLLPTEEQRQNIAQQIGNARFLKNRYLKDRNTYYKETEKKLTVAEYKKEYLPAIKEENPFLYLSDKYALESALERVETAYKNFFEGRKRGDKVGFPKNASKYKPNGNSYKTKNSNNAIELLTIDGLPYLKIPKVGKVRFVMPSGYTMESMLGPNSRITSATIKRANNLITASLCIESIVDIAEHLREVDLKQIISSDLGIKNFAVYGNTEYTETVENPRFIKIHAKRIRRLNKSLSRKKKGSNNWKKTKAKLSKEYRKIKNQRRDFHHQVSRKIVNQCDVFACEDLNIKGMVKNRRLAKEIASVGWGQFLTYVQYKLERKGGIFIKVDRFYASSQLCNNCGYKNADVKNLKVRKWTCPECGTVHDRDENAKNNLLKKATEILEADYNIQVVA